VHAGRVFTLTASCPDRVGIIARVSGFIAGYNGWILESNYHSEYPEECPDNWRGRYFMRMEIKADSLPFSLDEFRERFRRIAEELEMNWEISDSAVKKRLVILVGKQEHCLYDLLARWKSGDLDVEIPCVISNHEIFRDFVEWHGIPFFYAPIAPGDKKTGWNNVRRLLEEAQGDAIVLARYMQILPSGVCERFHGRILNIHHSFLPSFIGAKPYHQAFRRGVKLIGATCHYVTSELDLGPIIEQDVIRINHSDSVEDLVRYGKDIEKTVLARALRYHLEDRVLLHGNKTVVFR
jgi:formyltetrahydrofolate deformylase